MDAQNLSTATPSHLCSLCLPWPPSVLSPNARVHWAMLAKAKKGYREVCFYQARQQGVRPLQARNAPDDNTPDVTRLHVALEFSPPSRRAFDLDNALAAMKSGLDGLADALRVDDRYWSLSIAKAPEGIVLGMVMVQVFTAHNNDSKVPEQT